MSEPIPMILFCPLCGARHVDRGEFTTRPHHTHACQDCGLPWRPAIVATVGVQFLPGFKDPAEPAFESCLRDDGSRLVYPLSCTDCYGKGKCQARPRRPACAFAGGCIYGSACGAAGACIRLERSF